MFSIPLNSKVFIALPAFALLGAKAFAALPTAETDSARVVHAERETMLMLPQVSVTAIKGGSEANHDEAITTVGQKEIERLNINNVKQVSALAPNFYMPAYGSRMTSTVYVRGLGTRIDQPVVGLNIDNVPILNKDNFDFDLADIARIEVVRGPQNILYGRNTMGGLINIYTLSPFSFQGVRGTLEYGTQNSRKISLGLYKLLTPRLGMALSGYYTGTDGFYRNEFNDAKVGAEQNAHVRWRTVWRPLTKLIVENSATASFSSQSGYPYKSVKEDRIAYNDTCFYRRCSFTDGLTAKAYLGNVTLSGIGSFQYIDDNLTLDQDFLTKDYFTLTQKRREWAVTADVVARGTAGSRYNWLAGVFGFARQARMEAPVTFKDYGLTHLIEHGANSMNPDYPIRWDSRSLLLGSRFRLPSSGLSFYHESAYKAGPYTFTLGLRWDREWNRIHYNSDSESTYTVYQTTPEGTLIPYSSHIPVVIHDQGTLSKAYSQLLPKLSVSRTLPFHTTNVFASVTKGYKAGGYNTQMFSNVLEQRIMGMLGLKQNHDIAQIMGYAPEKAWNFETGLHHTSLDGRFNLDATLFWLECRDQQLTRFLPGAVTGRMMDNAGRSRSRGVELSTSLQLPLSTYSSLLPRLSYGFTDARFLDYSDGKQNYRGNSVPYAPSHTLFGAVTFTHRFKQQEPMQSVSADINCRGIGNIYWNEANTLSQPFYALLNASLRANFTSCSVELWANNLTSTQYATFYFVSIQNAFLQQGPRFSCGVTLRTALDIWE